MRFHSIAALATMLVSGHAASAWEVTKATGPVAIRGGIKSYIQQEDQGKKSGGGELRNRAADIGTLFGPRTVAYPHDEGVSLGQGWDFVLNRKKQHSCIVPSKIRKIGNQKGNPGSGGQDQGKKDNGAPTEVGPGQAYDAYQVATGSIRHVIDEETLDVAVNASFSGKAKGTYSGFTGSAESRLALDTNYHYSSTDEVLVAKASVKQGAVFLGPNAGLETIQRVSDPGPALRSQFSRLITRNDGEFRERCGDGYVASIVSGADLYLLFHFRNVDEATRIRVEFTGKASVGFGDMFGAEGSSALATAISTAKNNKTLEIRSIQQGGKIAAIPTDLASAKSRVAQLPSEAWLAPRPLYIIVVPYGELAAELKYPAPLALDLRQKALRYYQRLLSVYFELLNIREDYKRDRREVPPANNGEETGIPKTDLFYYSYIHNQRAEDTDALADVVLKDIYRTIALLETLESQTCLRTPKRDRVLPSDCSRSIVEQLPDDFDFDDLKYWLQMPLPATVIPAEIRTFLEDANSPAEEAAGFYAYYLYHFWIERQSQIRCRLFFDCVLQTSDAQLALPTREQYWRLIINSLCQDNPEKKPVLCAQSSAGNFVQTTAQFTGWQRDDASRLSPAAKTLAEKYNVFSMNSRRQGLAP